MILLHCTFTDDVLGIGQDSGYVNWYGQRMVISVFCIFVSPSFTCSLHSFHLNQRSRFWFGEYFFKKHTLLLDHYGLRNFCCPWLTNKNKFFPGLICYRIRVANEYWSLSPVILVHNFVCNFCKFSCTVTILCNWQIR